jgi:hypothetical protein
MLLSREQKGLIGGVPHEARDLKHQAQMNSDLTYEPKNACFISSERRALLIFERFKAGAWSCVGQADFDSQQSSAVMRATIEVVICSGDVLFQGCCRPSGGGRKGR